MSSIDSLSPSRLVALSRLKMLYSMVMLLQCRLLRVPFSPRISRGTLYKSTAAVTLQRCSDLSSNFSISTSPHLRQCGLPTASSNSFFLMIVRNTFLQLQKLVQGLCSASVGGFKTSPSSFADHSQRDNSIFVAAARIFRT